MKRLRQQLKDCDLNSLRVRKRANSIWWRQKIFVSDESLITFMQEQGFSRADMAELLVAGHEGQSSDAQLTANWLKVRADNALGVKLQSMSDSLSVDKIKTTDLAEALAKQLIEPRNSIKSSAILEVLAAKHIPQQLRTQLASESSDQMMIKFTDLLPSLAKKPLGGGSSNQEVRLILDLSLRSVGCQPLFELSKGPESQEFREFLADHLKRAESLRELTDKLVPWLLTDC